MWTFGNYILKSWAELSSNIEQAAQAFMSGLQAPDRLEWTQKAVTFRELLKYSLSLET